MPEPIAPAADTAPPVTPVPTEPAASPDTSPSTEPQPSSAEQALAAVNAALSQGEPPSTEAPKDEEGGAAHGVPPESQKAPEPKAAETPLEPDAGPAMSDEDKELLGSLKERSQTRFRELHAQASRVDELEAELGQWHEVVRATGASPEEFAQGLQYMALVHSGDPASLQQALTFLDRERTAIAKRLGVPVAGVDLLADHNDLKQQVEAGELSESAALEIARLRSVQAEAEQARRTQQADAERTAALQAGRTAVDEMATKLREADPLGYDAKMGALKPMIEVIATTVPPNQWAEALRRAYVALPAIAAAAPAPAASAAPRPAPGPQPLRPSPGGGGGSLMTTPNSALEAVNQALGVR